MADQGEFPRAFFFHRSQRQNQIEIQNHENDENQIRE